MFDSHRVLGSLSLGDDFAIGRQISDALHKGGDVLRQPRPATVKHELLDTEKEKRTTTRDNRLIVAVPTRPDPTRR